MNKALMAAGASRLRAIKLAHTVIWAFFATCILAMPVAAWHDRYDVAAVLAVVVLAEVAVLLANGMTCPLTPLAAKHTSDRAPNFDIYLPRWLAARNKAIFGTLYAAGLAFVLVRWIGASA
ncbi:MAG: hypothetical protein KJ018_02040 [Burkholderiales bacterium]|nr:hypothetical protein [Burkholderiales bacterium]GIK84647.1 MAG: hypothetical protein BroJett026_01280 [Betaproteobacteria bacterium]